MDQQNQNQYQQNQQGYGQQGTMPNQQPGYMPPPPQQPGYVPYMQDKTAPLSLGQYLIMFLLMALPIVNIIMPFVWAFGDTNVNKKNYARALLIMMLIGIVLSIIFSTVILSIMSAVINSSQYGY